MGVGGGNGGGMGGGTGGGGGMGGKGVGWEGGEVRGRRGGRPISYLPHTDTPSRPPESDQSRTWVISTTKYHFIEN